jgi:RNA polymerase sigma-70 factor (ECF subfamily)
MTEPQIDAAPHALVEAHLVAGRAYLLAYVASRVDDPALAEDVVQDSLLRALRAAPGLRDEEKLVPWFRRIVANAIADVYRRREREVASLDRYRHEREGAAPPAEDEALCLCFRALLPTLKDEYRVLIEALELEGRDPDAVASDLGITRNNLNVRRHRARRQLRERLEALCTACPDHGFHACDCSPLGGYPEPERPAPDPAIR